MDRSLISRLVFIFFSGLASGCAVLHHVQVGQIDNRQPEGLVPFEIMMSETGVNLEEAGNIAKSTNSYGGDNVKAVTDIVGMFQIGPRTGNPIYNPQYAEKLIYQIYQKCPSGKVTNLMSIREMRKYPVISGEIVKVTGFCRKPIKVANINSSATLETASASHEGEIK